MGSYDLTNDRWIRTRFPFKSNSLYTPRKALLVAGILFIIVVGLNSHMLLPYVGLILPGIPHLACGPNGANIQYTIFYYFQWTIIQVSISIAICMFYVEYLTITHKQS